MLNDISSFMRTALYINNFTLIQFYLICHWWGNPVVKSFYTGPPLYEGNNLYMSHFARGVHSNKQYCPLIGQEVTSWKKHRQIDILQMLCYRHIVIVTVLQLLCYSYMLRNNWNYSHCNTVFGYSCFVTAALLQPHCYSHSITTVFLQPLCCWDLLIFQHCPIFVTFDNWCVWN